MTQLNAKLLNELSDIEDNLNQHEDLKSLINEIPLRNSWLKRRLLKDVEAEISVFEINKKEIENELQNFSI
jgi:hypothetical protein